MFRLTREVRFGIGGAGAAGARASAGEAPPGLNGYAGAPPLVGLGYYFTLAATIEGDPEPQSNYVVNIRDVDQQVRRIGVPLLERNVRESPQTFGAATIAELFGALKEAWLPARLQALRLSLSPLLALSVIASEYPMTRLSHTFEFSASHRLHNPALPEAQNRELFGKCNNPHGHGHNYQLQVTLAGPGEGGMVMPIPQLERIVQETVIDRFDHRNLNVELPEFAQRIPSVENIAQVIYRLLAPRLKAPNVRLASVTVWETPKTWCEYGEE